MDILRRYPVASEDIHDEDGNSLVAIAAMKGQPKILTILLLKGFDPNTQNFEGNTPLRYACDGNYLKCIDILLTYGANEDIENNSGIVPW